MHAPLFYIWKLEKWWIAFDSVEFYPEDGFHKLHTVRWGLRDEHFNQWFWNTDSGNQLLGVFNEAIIGGKPMLGYEGELVGHGG